MSLMRVGERGGRSASPQFGGRFFIHARSGYLSGLLGPSSNGRTADFGSVNGGSNPPGPTVPFRPGGGLCHFACSESHRLCAPQSGSASAALALPWGTCCSPERFPPPSSESLPS